MALQPSSAPTSTCTDLFLANRQCAKNNCSSHPFLSSNFLGKVVDKLLLSVVFWFLVCLFLLFFSPPKYNMKEKKNHVMKKFHLSSLSAMLIEKNILYIADSLLFSSSVNSWHLLSHAWNINSPVQPHQIILYSSLCHYSQNKNNKKEGNFFVCVQKCFGLLGRLVGTWSISWKHRTSQILWTARILPKSQTFWYSFVNCVGWAQHPSEIMKAF